MAVVKYSDEKSRKNRERVRKHRLKQKSRSMHEKQVFDRIKSLDKKDTGIGNIEHNQEHDQSASHEIDDLFAFTDKLRFWAVNYRITARAINGLLGILIAAGFTNLPKDSRTFMRTPSSLPIKCLSSGKMWYNGLQNSISNVFCNLNQDVVMTLDFNFDGCPVFKSSNLQFWPILVAIKGIS